jgi:hypothetical protein
MPTLTGGVFEERSLVLRPFSDFLFSVHWLALYTIGTSLYDVPWCKSYACLDSIHMGPHFYANERKEARTQIKIKIRIVYRK